MTEGADRKFDATTRKRGRPKQMCQAEREALVLDCAIELFSERGLENVTMADIARRAGMSKRTLYDLYRSREELLGAGLSRMSRTLFRPLRPDEREASLEERLRILLTLNPDKKSPAVVIEMLRTVIAAARSFPEMGRRLSNMGPGQVASLLREELEHAARAGEIDLASEEISAAADLLVDMVFGDTIPCLLDPNRILRSPEEKAARRDRAIAIFLNGVRPRDK
ncbi:TetR/AcrR family transcriptional regulator [Tropicimonas sp. IMCC6043]|uniref:TetR/AcrR family transcriptional regulator n=1 Tax=Tropicimonas sp. IMCC6043 TaxID=2510645 RepID=UPI00101BB2C7|nr:TetR/AcrR family transcriptional regulator [Tropicimonas sp. IMCC6043]RYH07843.1 TetR/AcrR family transcriptional regulator [Tropicimonas sp. IMCC6043]